MQCRMHCAVALALLGMAAPHAAAQGSSATQVAAATAAAGSGTTGAGKAQAAGIPVDTALLAANPEFASVPVGPPKTDSSAFALDPDFGTNASAMTGDPAWTHMHRCCVFSATFSVLCHQHT